MYRVLQVLEHLNLLKFANNLRKYHESSNQRSIGNDFELTSPVNRFNCLWILTK